MWNNINLNKPPVNLWETTVDQFDSGEFTEKINKIIKELKNQKVLHSEAACLSRLTYRMKSKYRHDKGFKNMEKINRALTNYLKLSLDKHYKFLIDNIVINNRKIKLVSRQMLEYTLVETQGFAKLMARLDKVALDAAMFLKGRINIGQSWPMAMICLAIVARIWILSRNLIEKCCDWYETMHPFLFKLQLVGVSYLPESYELPDDLRKWLSLPWLNDKHQRIEVDHNLNNSIFNMITMNHNSPNEMEDDAKLKEEVKKREIDDRTKNLVESDIGEPIDRQLFKINSEIKQINKNPQIIKMKSNNDIKSFLNKEYYPGVSKGEWNDFKNLIRHKMKKMTKCQTKKEKKLEFKKITDLIQKFTS